MLIKLRNIMHGYVRAGVGTGSFNGFHKVIEGLGHKVAKWIDKVGQRARWISKGAGLGARTVPHFNNETIRITHRPAGILVHFDHKVAQILFISRTNNLSVKTVLQKVT